MSCEFVRARDLLLAHSEDYEAACSEFRWPQDEEFNWALDYFDQYAEGNSRTGLLVIDQSGVSTRMTFAQQMLILQDLSRYKVMLRELTSAGEPLNPEVMERVRAAWGLAIRDGYGQTESTAQVGNSPGQPVKPGSMGRPLTGYAVDLLSADGEGTRRK